MDELEVKAQCYRIATRAKEIGLSQSQLASAINSDQSQISRVLAGKIKRPTRVFQELCIYVLKGNQGIDPCLVRESEVLVNALASVWDGTSSHASALANVIKALGAFRSNTR